MRLKLTVGALLAFSVLASTASAQELVYDAKNFTEAATALNQSLAQVIALQAQVQKLTTDTTTPLPAVNSQATAILQQAQGIGFASSNVGAQYSSLYPTSTAGLTGAQITAAQSVWTSATQQALQTAMATQNAAAQTQPTTASAVQGAVAASQSAVGSTGATQATNQILASVSTQLAQLIAILTTQARAQESLAAQRIADAAAASTTTDAAAAAMNPVAITPAPGVSNTTSL
jgi:P-type conjugative transfer protein TrbJ